MPLLKKSKYNVDRNSLLRLLNDNLQYCAVLSHSQFTQLRGNLKTALKGHKKPLESHKNGAKRSQKAVKKSQRRR